MKPVEAEAIKKVFKKHQKKIVALEIEVGRLNEMMDQAAQLINNLNDRLMKLEGDKKEPILPPTKEEVHARMEIDGDSYQECEARIMREKYARPGDGTATKTEAAFHVPV